MQAVKEGDQIEFLRPIAGSVRNREPSIDDAGVFRALRRRLDRRTEARLIDGVWSVGEIVRDDSDGTLAALKAQGLSIREIAERTGLLVRDPYPACAFAA
jgi:hypothetical protein